MAGKKQHKIELSMTEEEDVAFNRAYAQYLLDSDEHLSKNKWMIKKIKESLKDETF